MIDSIVMHRVVSTIRSLGKEARERLVAALESILASLKQVQS